MTHFLYSIMVNPTQGVSSARQYIKALESHRKFWNGALKTDCCPIVDLSLNLLIKQSLFSLFLSMAKDASLIFKECLGPLSRESVTALSLSIE